MSENAKIISVEKDDFSYLVFSELNQQFKSHGSRRKAFAIIEGAVHAFNKHGLDSTSLNQIASACGCAESMIKYYFKSLHSLKIACAMYCRLLYQKYVIAKMQVAEKFVRLFEIYFDASLEWPQKFPDKATFWIQLMSASVQNEEWRLLNSQAVSAGLARLVAFVELGIKAGEFKLSDTRRATELVHAAVTGAVLASITQNDFTIQNSLKASCLKILTGVVQ
jgi:AcrR family transcriptional regulator